MTKFLGKQQFRVEHPGIDDIGCVIEIDFGYPDIMQDIREYYEFYHDAEGIVEEKIIERFLQHIAGAVFHVAANGKLNTQGVRSEIAQWEGYPALDGSQGFRLMQHEYQNIEDSDFTIGEVSGYEYFEAE